MKRTPIVVMATAAGLAGLLTYRTKPVALGLGSSLALPSASLPGGTPNPTTSSTATSAPQNATTIPRSTTAPPITVTHSPSTTTLPATTTPRSTTTSPSTVTHNPSTTTTLPATTTTPPTTTPPTTTTTPISSATSATGSVVNYSYGTLSVSIGVSGSKITNVQIASLNDGGNFRSQSIDQQSLPILEQETLQAQSANIQSVSGASYTSAGFVQSLQSALSKLGM